MPLKFGFALKKLIFLLWLISAPLCFSQIQYEPYAPKLKRESGVLTAELYSADLRKVGFSIKNGKFIQQRVKVRYNPVYGLMDISGSVVEKPEVFVQILAYNSDGMWLGSSDAYEVNFQFTGVFFVEPLLEKQISKIEIKIPPESFQSDVVCNVKGSLLFAYYNSPTELFCSSQIPEDFWVKQIIEDFSYSQNLYLLERKKHCYYDKIWDEEDNSCLKIPENAHRVDETHWECDSGFYEVRGVCLASAVCNDFEVTIRNSWNYQECEKIPENSHKVDDEYWLCDSGFYEVKGKCLSLALAPAPDVEFEKIPENDRKVDNEHWKCDSGYINKDGFCEKAYCGDLWVFSDSSLFECRLIPENAYKVNPFEFSCNLGYEYDSTEDLCKKKYSISTNLSLEFGGFFGYSESIFNGGGEIGLEFLLGKEFNFGPAITVSGIFEEHDGLFFSGVRMNFAILLGLGPKSGLWKIYLRPFLSSNLLTSVEYETKEDEQRWWNSPANTQGVEFGWRLGNSLEKDFACDFYFSFGEQMFRDEEASKNTVVLFGLRFILI